MLRQDVLDAVAAGKFHIYSVSSIDQALEILTGFSHGSIDECVLARVEELQEQARKFSAREDKADE